MELAGAVFLGLILAPFLYVAAPGFPGGEPDDWQTISFAVGACGILIGLIWMIRLYRADPEPDQRAWRYRGRD